MSSRPPPKKVITVALTPGIIRRVDAVAKVKKVSRSQMIEDLVEESIVSSESMSQVVGNPLLMQAFMQALAQPGVLNEMARAMRQRVDVKQMQMFEETLHRVVEESQATSPEKSGFNQPQETSGERQSAARRGRKRPPGPSGAK